MPNGESKNWIRFCAAIEGFRSRYGKWPSTVKVLDFFPDELERVLSEADHAKLLSKINVIGDDSPFVAIDESGNSYDYGHEGFSEKESDIQASDWLDVNPDYYD
jgi:hypothetical protein